MKVAALAARADELRTRMRESHLANFRTEAKRRWALPPLLAFADTCCVIELRMRVRESQQANLCLEVERPVGALLPFIEASDEMSWDGGAAAAGACDRGWAGDAPKGRGVRYCWVP